MIKQAAKYCIVGVGNTLLSLAVIWVLTKKVGCTEVFSNFVGYVVGITNSFFWNRRWTFRSEGPVFYTAVKFFIVCAISYLLQLAVLIFLNKNCPENPPLYSLLEPVLNLLKIDSLFYIQIISMVVYTVVSFLINKYYTFKK